MSYTNLTNCEIKFLNFIKAEKEFEMEMSEKKYHSFIAFVSKIPFE